MPWHPKCRKCGPAAGDRRISSRSDSTDTVLHQIVFQFKGDDMIRCEQIAEESFES